jgi:DNA polymerase-3 subunit epsilon
MNYFAIDVETANANSSSVCQIGIVEFKNDSLVQKWSTLINPESFFDPFNSNLHGITEDDVTDSPTFDEVHAELKKMLEGKIVLHHTPFDRNALNRACQEYKLDVLRPKWLDSASIVRRAWPEFASKGYGLSDMAEFLGFQFQHHDALEDAIAAAKIVLAACNKTGLSIEAWLERVGRPVHLYDGGSSTLKIQGNENGPLYGENIVFTGALSLPRHEAAKIAAQLGCNVKNSVSKKTTILVVGIQTSSKLVGYTKSSKHRKAEDLINSGQSIKIISENDFVRLCNDYNKKYKLSDETNSNMSATEQNDSYAVNAFQEDKKSIGIQKLKSVSAMPNENNLQQRKRNLSKRIKPIIDEILANCPEDEAEELSVCDTIELELNDLTKELNNLSKNKISEDDFIEILDEVVISSIEVDYELDREEGPIPNPISKYVDFTLNKLSEIKQIVKECMNPEEEG